MSKLFIDHTFSNAANVDDFFFLGVYDARMRVLILYVANMLNVPLQLVELFEESVIDMLTGDIPTESEQDVKEKEKRQRIRKIKRYCMIGLAGTFHG